MAISQALLPEFDEEMKNTRKILERVPDGKFDYRPHPKSMLLGHLATHVAQFPSWAKDTLEHEAFDIPPDFKPPLAASRAELLEMFDSGVAAARKKIESASDADWHKIWSLKVAGKTLFQMPRVAVIRGMEMNHMIHHRAQLGVYLRMNEIALPGMYGPSADEPDMFASQSA